MVEALKVRYFVLYLAEEFFFNGFLFQEGDFERLLQIEEESIKEMVQSILKHKPDLVVTEKGLDERAQHYFVKVGRKEGKNDLVFEQE